MCILAKTEICRFVHIHMATPSHPLVSGHNQAKKGCGRAGR